MSLLIEGITEAILDALHDKVGVNPDGARDKVAAIVNQSIPRAIKWAIDECCQGRSDVLDASTGLSVAPPVDKPHHNPADDPSAGDSESGGVEPE